MKKLISVIGIIGFSLIFISILFLDNESNKNKSNLAKMNIPKDIQSSWFSELNAKKISWKQVDIITNNLELPNSFPYYICSAITNEKEETLYIYTEILNEYVISGMKISQEEPNFCYNYYKIIDPRIMSHENVVFLNDNLEMNDTQISYQKIPATCSENMIEHILEYSSMFEDVDTPGIEDIGFSGFTQSEFDVCWNTLLELRK